MREEGFDNRPLAVKVYQRLLEEILSGKREKGARISEESIAQELGISRTPAREALMRLSAEGLVEREARKGCRIAPVNREAMKDRFECRAMLESLTLELAFEHLPMPDLLELEEELCRAKDSEASLAADERLHQLIYDACPNRSLVEIVGKLLQQCRALRAYRAVARPVEPVTAERLEIVRALIRGDREGAKALLSTHILGGIAPGNGII